MKELTSQEMASYDGGRLICILLGIAAEAAAFGATTIAGIGALAGAVAAFIDAGCAGGDGEG